MLMFSRQHKPLVYIQIYYYYLIIIFAEWTTFFSRRKTWTGMKRIFGHNNAIVLGFTSAILTIVDKPPNFVSTLENTTQRVSTHAAVFLASCTHQIRHEDLLAVL